jgi:predicted XRE-type DNA-binding protein
MVKNPHFDTSLDDFLKEENILEEANARSLKKVLVWQIEEAMKASGLTKIEMAHRMGTSRAQLNRLLDPDNESLTLSTLASAAAILGKQVELRLK